MAATWWDLLGAAFGGGLGVKLLDRTFDELKRRSEATKSAQLLLDTHLDPILKAADEIVGKLSSLAGSDFKELRGRRAAPDNEPASALALPFLLVQFWGRVQILREHSVYVNLATTATGKKLLVFLQALEASKTSLVERASQRAMGEALIVREPGSLRSCTFFEFGEEYLASETYRTWFAPLASMLGRLQHTSERQRLLEYGAILHALMDTLDTSGLVTRELPTWANKLTARTRRDLQHRVFPVYLKFVKSAHRYYRPEDRELPRSK